MTQVKVRPLGDRVLVRRSKAPISKGGILLPETAKEKPKEGQVIKVGPGKINENGSLDPMNVKEGQRVLFSSYSGTEVKTIDDEEEYLILSEKDILGIIE